MKKYIFFGVFLLLMNSLDAHGQEYHEKIFSIHENYGGSLTFKNVSDTTHYFTSFPVEQVLANPVVAAYDDYAGESYYPYYSPLYKVGIAVNDTIRYVDLNYWIFDSIDDAEWWTLFQIKLHYHIGVRHAHEFGIPDVIGDNCFYSGTSMKHIHFLRKNVLVQLDLCQTVPCPEAVYSLAQVVDSLLVAMPVVKNRSDIPTPKITDWEIIKEQLYEGGIIQISMNVTNPRNNQYVTRYATSIYDEEDTLTPWFEYDPNRYPIKFWVETEDRYVSSIDYFTQPPR